MFSHFQAIVRLLTGSGTDRPGLTHINTMALFNPKPSTRKNRLKA